MSSDDDGCIFIESGGVSFTGLWFPALKSMWSGGEVVFYIF